MSEQKTSKYPVDYDLIQKGDYWTDDEIERILMIKRGTPAYQLLKFSFQAQIERELRARGKDWEVIQRNDRVCVLDDREASIYGERRIDKSVRNIFRRARKLRAVDVSELSQEDRDAHDKRMMKAAFVTCGLKGASDSARAHFRSTKKANELPAPAAVDSIDEDEDCETDDLSKVVQ